MLTSDLAGNLAKAHSARCSWIILVPIQSPFLLQHRHSGLCSPKDYPRMEAWCD